LKVKKINAKYLVQVYVYVLSLREESYGSKLIWNLLLKLRESIKFDDKFSTILKITIVVQYIQGGA
jgi:hypothetical protein